MKTFLIDTDNPPALGPIERDRYVFCCNNGCGECQPVLVTLRTYHHAENGRTINERTHPDIVSSCCGEPMFVWDSKRETEADPAYRTVSIELPMLKSMTTTKTAAKAGSKKP
jgi:hypothetical protein